MLHEVYSLVDGKNSIRQTSHPGLKRESQSSPNDARSVSSVLACNHLLGSRWLVPDASPIISLFMAPMVSTPTIGLLMQYFVAQTCQVGIVCLLAPLKVRYYIWAGLMVPFMVFYFMVWNAEFINFFEFAVDLVGTGMQICVCWFAIRRLLLRRSRNLKIKKC